MAVLKAFKLKGGGTLLVHTDGKKTYVPTIAYREKRKEHTKIRCFKGKPDTKENCFKLLNSIHKLLVAYKMKSKASVNN